MAFFRISPAGFVAPFQAAPQPYIDVGVEIDGARGELSFRIDTGADITTIQSSGALALFGDIYLHPNFRRRFPRIETSGVGGTAGHMAAYADLLVETTGADEPTELYLPILIAEPNPPAPPSALGEPAGTWGLPNLLGLDVLRYFEFRLRYGDDPAVMLLA